MWLQPVQPPSVHNPSCRVAALISPLQGHTQEEVVSELEKFGAKNLHFPTDGFISAEINPNSVENLQNVATVEIKQAYQMRNEQNGTLDCS